MDIINIVSVWKDFASNCIIRTSDSWGRGMLCVKGIRRKFKRYFYCKTLASKLPKEDLLRT